MLYGFKYIKNINKKANILIIGNKPLTKDYTDFLKSKNFNIVCRINRATNYEQTRIKTDIILSDIYCESILNSFHKCSYYQEILDNAKCIIDFTYYNSRILEGYPKVDPNKIYHVDFENNPYIKYYFRKFGFWNGYRITNAIWMILFMMYKCPFNNITLFGIDKDDRSFNSSAIAHKYICKLEEEFINNQIKEQRLDYIYAE